MPLPVYVRRENVCAFGADILVEDSEIVELKAVNFIA